MLIRSIAFAAALAFAAGAHAEDRSVVRVDINSYDLSKPADAAVVYAKLQQAARTACTYAQHEVFVSDEAERFDLCYRDAMERVVAQSKAPLLAALNGQPVSTVQLAGR